jgi:anti-sigma factor RsiW
MDKQKCADSLELLSEYHAGRLDEAQRGYVETHLADCLPCAGVLQDVGSIVAAAAAVARNEEGIAFPDEDALWQRMAIGKPAR